MPDRREELAEHRRALAEQFIPIVDEIRDRPRRPASFDDCCGSEPPAGGRWGDCWCTLPPGHTDEHYCQPCTERHGAPGWADEPATQAAPEKPMSDRQFPYEDGDVTVLGPEIFASKGGAVVCWKGENYVRQQFSTLEVVRDDQTPGAIHELASAVRDLVSAIRLEIADRAESSSVAAQEEQGAPVDWQAVVQQRERELKTVGERKHAAEQEIARLRAGEEPGGDPASEPTPGQWIARWNQASAEERLRVAQQVLEGSARAARCFLENHVARLHDAEEAVKRVRAEVVRIRAVTRTWGPVADLIDAALTGPGQLKEQRERPAHPDGTPYSYAEMTAEGWGFCDGCRIWSTATPERPHQCPETHMQGPVIGTARIALDVQPSPIDGKEVSDDRA